MDIRSHLVEEKHYAFVPVPVIEMLAKAGLSGTQMSIYMLHWSAGHIAGDWKSTIAVSVLVERLQVSRATVQRAYRGLVKKGMIRRAIGEVGSFDIPEVEVLIPECLEGDLAKAPSRRKAQSSPAQRVSAQTVSTPHETITVDVELDDPEPFTNRYREEQARLRAESSLPELPDKVATSKKDIPTGDAFIERLREIGGGISLHYRSIHPKYAYKIRAAIAEIATPETATNLWYEVMWSIERGIFYHRNVPHAFNTAMWLLRRGMWERPVEMPNDWRWSYNPCNGPVNTPSAAPSGQRHLVPT